MKTPATKTPRKREITFAARAFLKLTVAESSDSPGVIVLGSRAAAPQTYPGLEINYRASDWPASIYYADWPEGERAQYERLMEISFFKTYRDRAWGAAEAVERIARRFRREPCLGGVPVSELPEGLERALRRPCPRRPGQGESVYYTQTLDRIGPVFQDGRAVLAGVAPPRAPSAASAQLAALWGDFSSRRGHAIVPVAYSGTKREGTVWFAPANDCHPWSFEQWPAIEARYYAYLVARFGHLTFSCVEVGGCRAVAAFSSRRRVGFVSVAYRGRPEGVRRLLRAQAEQRHEERLAA